MSALAILAAWMIVQTPASPEAPARRPPVATIGAWEIHDHRGACSASSIYDGSVIIDIHFDFGRNSAWLSITSPAWESVEDGVSYPAVRIDFNNGRYYADAQASGFRVDNRDFRLTGIRMHLRGDEFLADFATAGGMSLRMGEIRMVNLSLRGTRPVMERLARCSGESFRRYPPDPFAGLSRSASSSPSAPGTVEPARARGNLQSYFSMDDYPSAALRAREEGTTAFRLTVGADGRIGDCTITSSSGSASLDSATSRILRSRARFTPARDNQGQPTNDTVSSRIRWALPADQPTAQNSESLSSIVGGLPVEGSYWVQIGGGAIRAGLSATFARLRAQAPALLGNRIAFTTPLNQTNRLLLGPFDSLRSAQRFVNQLSEHNIAAFAWTSSQGQRIERVEP